MIRKSIIFLLSVIFCFHYCLGKGAVLRGYITIQNSGNPVQGVNVSAFGANPDVTDNFGRFELLFEKKNPGDVVTLQVEKPGLEVVKREGEELRFVLRSNPDELVRIVMRKIGEGARLEREYSGIAREAINKNYELLKENIQLKSDIKEKDKEIAKLTEQRDAALAQVEDAAKTFASVDLDQASILYKEAFAYFKKGDIDKALETLDDAKIEEAVRQAQEERRKAQERIKKSDEEIKKSADSYVLKAQLYITKLRFEQAENYFKKAIDLEPDNIYKIVKFADFLYDQNQFHKSRPWYEKALSLAKDNSDQAWVLNNFGNLLWKASRFREAENAYNEALLHYRELAENNKNAYLPYVATSLNNLGILYKDTSRFREAENAYNEALQHYRELAENNKNAYMPYVATSLHNLGLLYIGSKRYTEAVKALNEALEIREKFAKDNPDAFNIDLCDTVIPLSGLYILTSNEESMQSNSKKSISMLNLVISILEKYPHVPKAQSLLEKAKKLKAMYLIFVKK